MESTELIRSFSASPSLTEEQSDRLIAVRVGASQFCSVVMKNTRGECLPAQAFQQLAIARLREAVLACEESLRQEPTSVPRPPVGSLPRKR